MPFLTVVETGATPRVEFVGEIVAPQSCGDPDARIEVWTVDDKIVVTCNADQPVIEPGQCRQLADFMVAASRTCEQGI